MNLCPQASQVGGGGLISTVVYFIFNDTPLEHVISPAIVKQTKKMGAEVFHHIFLKFEVDCHSHHNFPFFNVTIKGL